MSYPKIIIYNEEIEIVHQQSDVDCFLYGIREGEQKNVRVLEADGTYHTLLGKACQPLSADELGLYVKHYLANEGQCCLSKIQQLSPQQAFDLLAIN